MEIQEYRGQLYEYLKNRMFAIAPNLTAVVGKYIAQILSVWFLCKLLFRFKAISEMLWSLFGIFFSIFTLSIKFYSQSKNDVHD